MTVSPKMALTFTRGLYRPFLAPLLLSLCWCQNHFRIASSGCWVFIFIVLKSSKCQYFTECYKIRLYALNSIILYPFFLDDVGKSYCLTILWSHEVKSQTRRTTLNKRDLEELKCSLVIVFTCMWFWLCILFQCLQRKVKRSKKMKLFPSPFSHCIRQRAVLQNS